MAGEFVIIVGVIHVKRRDREWKQRLRGSVVCRCLPVLNESHVRQCRRGVVAAVARCVEL